jgi:large subunit ribosomal protein L15
MNLTELFNKVQKHKKRKIVGRGRGSGHGKTCGRGRAGYKSRSGSGGKSLYEGGQTPFFIRLPKRGFNNKWRKNYAIINVEDLNRFNDAEEVTPERFIQAGLIKKVGDGVKVLGDGELRRKLIVCAHRFSQSALQKITAAGGEAKIIKK